MTKEKASQQKEIKDLVIRVNRWAASPETPRAIKESAETAMRVTRELDRARLIDPTSLREPISK